jgi:cation diffusion facilitator CzcD-associated flavoprotein CzcO
MQVADTYQPTPAAPHAPVDARAAVGSVLVIGAGPAGLASAYDLERAGIAYTVVERAGLPGSTWANLYRSLRLNTGSIVSHLPGEPISLRHGWYMSGTDFYAYLRRYAEAHAFPIRYHTEVLRVAPQGDGWCVELRDLKQGDDYRVQVPCVIVATGRFSNPYLPDIPGRETFRGRVLHARDYHEPEPFRGQRVAVIGNGPSGVDIALEVAEVAQRPVLLSVRSDIVIARRYPYGLPDTLWHLLARTLLPARWRRPFLDRVLYQTYRDAPSIGLRLAPDRTHRIGSSTPVRGRALIDVVAQGAIQPAAGIVRFTADGIETRDGRAYAADSVILSTGYCPAIGYLDFPFEVDPNGWPRRISDSVEGGETQVLGYPGLYLVGRYYRGLGPLHNIRHEAETAVHEIRQRLAALATTKRTGAE